MEKLDYKKAFKDLYMPKAEPAAVLVPPMQFLMAEGQGNPNTPNGEYQQSIGLLYALSYTIKMGKAGKETDGYFEYVVPPLEGLWWLSDGGMYDVLKKDKFCFCSMLRQPEFVTQELFRLACGEVERKKGLDTLKARLKQFDEGLCVQCMHIGPYDDEPRTLSRMHRYMEENGYADDVSDTRRHHEIYLKDPLKTRPENLLTVLRHPVRRIA
ncbi:MAG TPA: GyrI-like domain-containing protein [Feifaniaceae bacterium]|nr:GyrI-like domain-containing protein [Feifaniaceae bacterium]